MAHLTDVGTPGDATGRRPHLDPVRHARADRGAARSLSPRASPGWADGTTGYDDRLSGWIGDPNSAAYYLAVLGLLVMAHLSARSCAMRSGAFLVSRSSSPSRGPGS